VGKRKFAGPQGGIDPPIGKPQAEPAAGAPSPPLSQSTASNQAIDIVDDMMIAVNMMTW
jgi:hypothetical protein